MTDLDRVLDGIPLLAGQERRVTFLPGGLTNRNYRVRTGDGLDVVVRVSPTSTDLLAVDREREHRNSLAAAAAGVGAPVLDYLPGRGVLVVGFLPGRTYGDAEVAANLPRVAAALRRLHAGPVFAGRFDMFAIQAGYAAVCRERGFRLPDGYAALAPRAAVVRAALAVGPQPLVPCHNDLLAANFLDDGGEVRIIDYEYSGMNEPSFELGNLISEARLGEEALTELVTAYEGEERPDLVARAELWAIIARWGWTLWGVISSHINELDFDFWGWAMEKYEPAVEALTSPRIETLISRLSPTL